MTTYTIHFTDDYGTGAYDFTGTHLEMMDEVKRLNDETDVYDIWVSSDVEEDY